MNDYATIENPFTLINNTNSNLDGLLKQNLIVNTDLLQQPIKNLNDFSKIFNLTTSSYAGLVFNEWLSVSENQLTLLYNDSAMLSVPYLLNTLSNFYSRLEHSTQIKASISAWPKLSDNTVDILDVSSFSSMLILGTGLIIPLVSFATEIVHDREVRLF